MLSANLSSTFGSGFELDGSSLVRNIPTDLPNLVQNMGRSPAFSEPGLDAVIEKFNVQSRDNREDAFNGLGGHRWSIGRTDDANHASDEEHNILTGDRNHYDWLNTDETTDKTIDVLLGNNGTEVLVSGYRNDDLLGEKNTNTPSNQHHFSSVSPELAIDLQVSLERSLEEGNSPGSIAAVLTADGQLWTGATGLADVENNVSASASDRFPVGSVTKPFTATVIMQLVEEGVLSLDDTMNQWLSDSITNQIENSNEITIRQLLSHTSGINSSYMGDEYGQDLIADPSLIFQDWTPTDLLARYVYDREPSFAPGTDVAYNSVNYFLLGLIIESATDSTLTSEFRERIIEPLGLNNTFMPDEAIPSSYQPGYVDVDGDGVFDLNAQEADLDRFGGAGALISNVEDLTRFAQALFGGELVDSDTLNEMITGGVSIPANDSLMPEVGIGLGFGYQDITGQGRHFFANGDSYGWTVRLRYDQETGATTVIYRNGSNETATRDYADQALDGLLQITNDYQNPPQYGTEGNDRLRGTPQPDILYGLEGHDRISGRAGSDILSGNDGNDTIHGGAGLDWINGSAGRDRLYGGADQDYLIGGSGNDELIGGKGNDTLAGQSGDDHLRGGSGDDQLDGGDGRDTVKGGSGDNILIDPDGGILTGGQGGDEFRLGDGRLPDTPKITTFPPIPDFTIADFTIGEDKLTLNFGITFDDLTFLDTENGTVISTQAREGLLLLEGIRAQDLTPDSFYFGDAALQAALQAALENAVAESNFPGISISVTSPDGSIWTRTQGFSNLENQTPLTSDDRFVIGSVTKVFTATTVLQLAEEGRLTLDDPMSQWVPEIAARIPNGEQITIRQLLGHTSGIRDDSADLAAAYLANPEIAQREWTPEDFLELIYDKEPMGNPGQFGYSNPNYTILGEIVEAVTHSPLEQQFQSRIFEPLGLENTFYAYPEEIPGGYVKSYYDENGDGILEDILSQVHPSLSVKKAGGGMVSNPTDLNRFAQALFSGELLSPATLEEMVRDRNPYFDPFDYGLGVMYASLPETGRILGHEGAQDIFGWRANMYHLPDAGLTVSITANSFLRGIDPVGGLFDQVLVETFLPSA